MCMILSSDVKTEASDVQLSGCAAWDLGSGVHGLRAAVFYSPLRSI